MYLQIGKQSIVRSSASSKTKQNMITLVPTFFLKDGSIDIHTYLEFENYWSI